MSTKLGLGYIRVTLLLGTHSKIGVRMDENQLQILDDLPSSAVEMQVKDKVNNNYHYYYYSTKFINTIDNIFLSSNSS